jgi:hypothetical protein
VGHRLGTEDLVEDRGELRHIRRQLHRIGETRVGQKIRAADRLPSGDSIGRPPASGLPPGAVWQAPQSEAMARYSPRLISASSAAAS